MTKKKPKADNSAQIDTDTLKQATSAPAKPPAQASQKVVDGQGRPAPVATVPSTLVICRNK